MELEFKKRDFWLSVLAGEIVALLSFPTLKNLKVLEILTKRGISTFSFGIFWIIFVPAGAVFGLWLFYLIAKYKNNIGFFQLGKYGVVGVLNTFLSAGIFNFLIFVSDISHGIKVDVFLAVAFIITVVNSFLWNKYWSFEEGQAKELGSEAIKFFSVSAIVALLNVLILHIIVNVIGAPASVDPKIWANVGLGITIVSSFFGNFFGYKFFVFKK